MSRPIHPRTGMRPTRIPAELIPASWSRRAARLRKSTSPAIQISRPRMERMVIKEARGGF